MVDTQRAPQQIDAVQVIHSQHRRPLILILEKPKTLRFAGVFVTHKTDMYRHTVLREHSQHITLIKLRWKPSKVDVGCVFVIVVPGGLDWYAGGKFLLVKPFNFTHRTKGEIKKQLLVDAVWLCSPGDTHFMVLLVGRGWLKWKKLGGFVYCFVSIASSIHSFYTFVFF